MPAKKERSMIQGRGITLRLVHDIEECKKVVDEYNDLLQRSETDHTEIKSSITLLKQFSEDGLWGDKTGMLLITARQDIVVGTIHFATLSDFELEVGYRVYKTKHRGKGYVSEALSVFSAYLFATKSIRRLRLQIASENIASQKVAEKCGFKREGVLRQAYFYRGRICDNVIYGLLRNEAPIFVQEI